LDGRVQSYVADTVNAVNNVSVYICILEVCLLQGMFSNKVP
jgi:hypothetical protein